MSKIFSEEVLLVFISLFQGSSPFRISPGLDVMARILLEYNVIHFSVQFNFAWKSNVLQTFSLHIHTSSDWAFSSEMSSNPVSW